MVASILSVVLAYWFNWIAAAFMLIGLVDNVGVYSLWLKRRSWLNIILGGVSGGMPVLVGYSAIAATVSPLAIFMSALVIVWIPTHIWSLAIKVKEDYREAHVPMLPVIVSERVGTLCIAITSSLLAVFSLAIVFVVSVSPFYILSALVAGAVILGYSVKLASDRTEKTAWGPSSRYPARISRLSSRCSSSTSGLSDHFCHRRTRRAGLEGHRFAGAYGHLV